MTEFETDDRRLVDAAGKPLPRKTPIRERVRTTTVRTKAIIGSILIGLGIVGGAITNIDKITALFGDPKPEAATVGEDVPTVGDKIEVTKVRSIIDQPTSISDFANTAVMSLYWEVVLSNNGFLIFEIQQFFTKYFCLTTDVKLEA